MNIYSILYTYIRHDIQIPPFYACYNIVAGDDKHSNVKKIRTFSLNNLYSIQTSRLLSRRKFARAYG